MASGTEIAAAAAMNATLAVEAVAGRPTNDMNQRAVEDAAPQIASAIQTAINTTPEMQHVLNTETHFWQKRSFWSAGSSALAATLVVIEYLRDNIKDDEPLSLITLGLALYSGYMAFRAGTASAPLGQKPTQQYPQLRG